MSLPSTFIKNICINYYKHPFICILIPCFPYIFYQYCNSKYRLKIDDDDDDNYNDYNNDYNNDYDDNYNHDKNNVINDWINIEDNKNIN